MTQKADHPQTPPSPEERGVVTDVVVPIAQTVASGVAGALGAKIVQGKKPPKGE